MIPFQVLIVRLPSEGVDVRWQTKLVNGATRPNVAHLRGSCMSFLLLNVKIAHHYSSYVIGEDSTHESSADKMAKRVDVA